MKKAFLLAGFACLSALAMGADYGGTPFKEHVIPCTIEAEDYDKGGEGVAYHYKNTTDGSYRQYRDDAVCISNSFGRVVLGNNDAGNWVNYTVSVAEAGNYSVSVVYSIGVDNGSFDLLVDGVPVCPVLQAVNGGWDNYSTMVIGDIPLEAGTHVLRWYSHSSINFDKFVFERTGNYVKGISFANMDGQQENPGEFVPGPHNVPCTIEAEDYDLGGEGVAFHFKSVGAGNRRDYRSDAVGLSSGNGGIVLGNTSDGDWNNYTINVTQEGTYTISTICSSGVDNGRFDLRIDGEPVCRVRKVPNRGWDNYYPVAVEGIPLKAGEHVFQWYTYSGMNVDKFVFERTGDYGDGKLPGIFDYSYPMTQEFTRNPLFVTFPSQMYGSPFTGNLYTADPSAHVWHIDGKDVLYVYASHDMEPSKGCDRMDRYHVFSTEDMVNWTDHGEILNADDVREQIGEGSNGFMWAPDAAYNVKDGLYYFLFPHKVKSRSDGDDVDQWRMFMATSKNPAGPFEVQDSIPGMPNSIDPCIFIDDDGSAYVYVSGGGKPCWGGKLKDDNWLELEIPMHLMEGVASNFHEAPFVFKKDGRYYLTHSDGHNTELGGNQLLYAVSDSPLGPWTDKGVYMYPHGEETAHGSVVKFKGKWYQFYHTANYSGEGALRSVCFDELTFADNGDINIVHNWGTPKGGQMPQLTSGGKLVLQAEDYNEGGSHTAWFKRPDNELFVLGDRQEREISLGTEGGTTFVASMARKEWTRYSLNVASEGTYRVTIRMRRQGNSTAKFRLGVDGSWTGKEELTVDTPVGEWGETVISGVKIAQGEHYIEWRGASGTIDVDYISIEKE